MNLNKVLFVCFAVIGPFFLGYWVAATDKTVISVTTIYAEQKKCAELGGDFRVWQDNYFDGAKDPNKVYMSCYSKSADLMNDLQK